MGCLWLSKLIFPLRVNTYGGLLWLRALDCTAVKIFSRIPQALCLPCLSGNSSSYPNTHLGEVFFF
ncbi:mCG141159, isoform CRA_b, partial [Mus musculus]